MAGGPHDGSKLGQRHPRPLHITIKRIKPRSVLPRHQCTRKPAMNRLRTTDPPLDTLQNRDLAAARTAVYDIDVTIDMAVAYDSAPQR
jgi:hypothetical protein